MRSGQQNKRGRGRGSNNNNNNNNNRKNGNPLSRSYDSSGPDVKVRGTAQHVADKYMALARDAVSSSDHVMAENYFQHAEHYNRIIAAAQAQQAERAQKEERENAEEAARKVAENPVDPNGPQPVVEGNSQVEENTDEQPKPANRRRPSNRTRRQPRKPITTDSIDSSAVVNEQPASSGEVEFPEKAQTVNVAPPEEKNKPAELVASSEENS